MEMLVTVYFPSGLVESGILSYSIEGPKITLDNGEILDDADSRDGVSFSIRKASEAIPISTDEKILFSSNFTIRRYTATEIPMNEMYPASSGGWINRLSDSGSDALFVTHPIVDSEKYLLLIFDLENHNLLNVQKVNPYEIVILHMDRDWDAYKKLNEELDYENRNSLIGSILDSPAPKWNEFATLVEGITVPNLKIGKTMRDTMDQLVPKSFPSHIRDELMTFLSLVIRIKIPDEDPLEISTKYRSTPLLHCLIFDHIQCLIEGDTPPQYVRVFIMADRGILPVALQPATTAIENNPWDIAWYKLTSMFPDRRSRILQTVTKLNQNQEILSGLPISKYDATLSQEAWINRFAMIQNALQIRGHVQNQNMGLRTLIYIGGAHRWPHRHLAWTARLGNPTEKPPYIQVMVMPPSAVERIRRLRTNISEVSWSASNMNYNLFIDSKQKWKVNTTRILKSVEGQRSLKQLDREFQVKPLEKIFTPSMDEAKVLGLITWGLYMHSLELGEYDEFLEMNTERLREILAKLTSCNIIRLQYYLPIGDLASICFVCNGPSQKIQSLTRSLLKHAPSTTARITGEGEQSYIISRLPEDSVYDISTQLPKRAKEHEMDIKIYRVNAFAAYTHNLYKRLLKPDGTWDDDISGFLSQIRS